MKSKLKAPLEPKIYRLIDANINRLKEGVRVVEDIFRYIYDDKDIAKKLKLIRHKATFEDENLLIYRDVKKDVLKESIESEITKTSLKQIVTANIKRAQEASRVLEEIFKLSDTNLSQKFKLIRYELYDIESNLQKNRHFH